MTLNEKITIIISSISLIVAIASFIVTKFNATKIEKIYYGQTELSIRGTITSAKNRIANTIQESADNSYSDQLFKFAIEELLNAYEEACAKYIDSKVDKKRFRKTYYDEIKNIVENKEFDNYFKRGSKYNAITKVYDEWFNLEK